ncbi:MBL fold metallo-hydrolase [Saccharopolyspora sp. NPDC047091]|uniref:MBL fold metallo-hydrolase n=1 Tax=Saccharopolyspora sp. NPDC047091 TaxID=3155924 RepID=UPI003402AA70
MCDATSAGAAEVHRIRPRECAGTAVDPIRLEPVDEVRITVLMDNSFDALLPESPVVRRAAVTTGPVPVPSFEEVESPVGLRAEHGFSALVAVRRGGHESTVLFDAGISPDGVVCNADRLEADLGGVQAVVLSHGHHDHTGGLLGVLERRRGDLPVLLHPEAWTPRRLEGLVDLPRLSRRALEREGVAIVERRDPSLLVEGMILVTGEVDRTTEYERGMPAAHQRWTGEAWTHDPQVVDDQALVVHLRGRGLVVLTGCGHAGAVNILRHARRLTAVDDVHALIGGLHLSGPAFEPVIAPTVAELVRLRPDVLLPAHCTGWRANHALAAALPDAWIPSSSGSTCVLRAA